MPFNPEPGLVIRYDFLWKEEEEAGKIDGLKDRPCAIIIVAEPDQNNSSNVFLCPITHSPIQVGETGMEVPAKLARHLRLDSAISWVKTHQINTVIWEENRLPYGVVPAFKDQVVFGKLPQSFAQKIFQQVKDNLNNKTLKSTKRS